MSSVRRFGFGVVIAAAVAVPLAGTAAAEPVSVSVSVPFQINPAPYGNPNGSFDAFPGRCAAIIGEQPGKVRITGERPDGWGCYVSTPLQWVNLSTGATGAAELSDGLNGIPPTATLETGPGQVALILLPRSATVTPGLATFPVP